MRAVLLAAGMGKRLAAASGGVAKALAVVGGRALVEHQLATLAHAGFAAERIVVVTGCDGGRVEELVIRAAPRAIVVHNPAYHHQNLLSLLAARPLLGDGFLLSNVDHLMPYAIHRRLLHAPEDVVAAVDADRPLGGDDMKVALDGQGRLSAISKQLERFDRGYIGMTRCRAEAVPRYLDAAGAVLADVGPEKAVVEMILGRLAATGAPPAVCDCSGFRWAEVDTPDELYAAARELSSHADFFEQHGSGGSRRTTTSEEDAVS